MWRGCSTCANTGLAGILADDMGLGKTAQVLAHLLIEQQGGRLDSAVRSMVLPTSLIANWQAEAARITRRRCGCSRLQGAGALRETSPGMAEHDVVFTTYPLLWRDIDALAVARAWHLLILDEAQMVKNAASRAADRTCANCNARHRLCVTGTPLENHLGELWAHFDFPDARLPRRCAQLRPHLAQADRRPTARRLRAELLAQRVRPFILRRRKADVATELPPKTEVIRRVQLQGATARAVRERALGRLMNRCAACSQRQSFQRRADRHPRCAC